MLLGQWIVSSVDPDHATAISERIHLLKYMKEPERFNFVNSLLIDMV